jgi:bifunctional non-homologous end joining protein LigD
MPGKVKGGLTHQSNVPHLFRKACEFGLEGLVSKHRDRAYRAGASLNWVKVKNPKHPAMARVKEAFKDRF